MEKNNKEYLKPFDWVNSYRICSKCGKPIDMNKDEYVAEKCINGRIWHKACE